MLIFWNNLILPLAIASEEWCFHFLTYANKMHSLKKKKKKNDGPWIEIPCDKNQMHKIYLKL